MGIKTLEELAGGGEFQDDITAIEPKIISDFLETTVRAQVYAESIVRVNRDLLTMRSRTIDLPTFGSLSATNVAEGYDMTGFLTSANYDKVTVGVSKVGLAFALTTETLETAGRDVIRDYLEESARAIADKKDIDLFTVLVAGASGAVFTIPSTDLTPAAESAYIAVITARNTVKKNKWKATALVIKPDFEASLLQDKRFTDASQYGDREPILNGEIGKFAGLKVIVSLNLPAKYGTKTVHGFVVDPTRYATEVIRRNLDVKRWEKPDTDRVDYYILHEYGAKVVNNLAAAAITAS